jgi:nucleotide-binding universal stress UspA family protein
MKVFMSRVLLAVSERWVPDSRVDAIGDLVSRLGASMLAVHVAYGTEESGADVTPGERLLEQIGKQLRAKVSRGSLVVAGAMAAASNGGSGGMNGGAGAAIAGGGVETLFLFSNDIGAAILKVADEHQITMIVLGLSSKGMLTRLIEGNVAQEVIRGARVPVLLLPAEWMQPV